MIILLSALILFGVIVLISLPFFRTEEEHSVKPREVDILTGQKEEIYAALKDIEMDYRMGKLSQEDYEDLYATYRRKAVGLLKAIDHQEPAAIDSRIEEEVAAYRRKRGLAMKTTGWGSALSFFLLLLSPSAATSAVISGRLVNKTPGGQSVAGVEVVHGLEEGAQGKEEHRTSTDQQGRFRFDDVLSGAGLPYRLTIRYQGAEYTASAPTAEGAGKDLVIPVWDGTPDASKIRVTRHHLIAESVPEGVKVQEFLVVQNEGDRTFIGSKEVPGNRRATLEFTLPQGFTQVRYEDGLMECCIVPAEQGFVDTMDVKPGTREIMFSYQLSPNADSYRLLRRLDYATGEVDLFVAPVNLKVSSENLTYGEKISGQDREYLRFSGRRLDRGALLAVDLAGLPRSSVAWKWLVYAAVVLLIGGGFVYPLARRKKQAVGAPAAPASGLSKLELEVRKEELVAALASLDERFEAGLIREADYHKLRTEKKAMLGEVLQKLGE